MQLALIGLGKMGYNLALNLRRHGHTVVAYDRSAEITAQLAKEAGTIPADSLETVCKKLSGRRVVWLMVPAGDITESVINQFMPLLAPGDILIDAGNSNYKDSKRHYESLKAKGIDFLDCGTSGGMTGALNGACTMIGGEPEVYNYCKAIFDDLSVPRGSLYVGA
ncbi:MAG: NAD(P)-binding domain-containing protein, partial [Saprospiraceae bacterium]